MQLALLTAIVASVALGETATVSAAASPVGGISCQEIIIPVSATAKNINLPSNLTGADLTPKAIENIRHYGTKSVSGHYNIAARYCKPSRFVASRANSLQLLIHGITYTQNYWSGLAPPGTLAGQEKYSWVDYAAAQGYPTLSIDRLCNGNSSHPDGIDVCQLSFQTATVQSLISTAREGQLPGISTPFNRIVLVGHSFGSLLGSQLATEDPNAVDAMLLTGFGANLTNALNSFGLPGFMPARQVLPSRFGNLASSYVAATNETGVRDFFYYGDFTQQEVQTDYDTRGTVTVGETATLLLGQVPAPNYCRPLLVLDGDEDGAFCQTDAQATAATHHGNCNDPDFLQSIRSNFPEAQPFQVSYTPQTGHLVNLHLTAQKSYQVAHDFLANAGF